MAINTENIRSKWPPPKFKFELNSKFGVKVLKTAPLEWKNSSFILTRNIGIGEMFTGGVFSEFETDERLTFIKEGFRELYGIYLGNGEWKDGLFKQGELKTEASLSIYYFDSDNEPILLNTYELDFNVAGTKKIGKSAMGFSVKVKETGLLSKIQKRKKITIDLTRTRSLGSYDIIDYPVVPGYPLKKNINIQELTNNFNAFWSSGETSNKVAFGQLIYIPKQTINETDFDKTKTQSFTVQDAVVFQIGLTNCIFRKSEFKRNDVRFVGNIPLKSSARALGGTLYAAILDINDIDIVDPINLGTYSFKNPTKTSFAPFDFIIPTIEINQSVVFYVTNFQLTAGVRTFFSSNNMIESVINVQATTVEGMPKYEALERMFQMMTDTQFPIKSDFYGRTDVVKNINGDTYASEDQRTFGSIVPGLAFRGLPLSDPNVSIAVKPEEMIKSYAVLDNVGFGTEIIDGQEKIVIERWDYFFPNEVGLDLSDRVNPTEIEEEVLIKSAIAEVVTGFDEFSYESINGRAEYNTKNTRTSENPTDTKIELVSKAFRGDSKGMFIQLEKPVTGEGAQASEDVDGDDDSFILNTQRDGNDWKPETDENITILNNSSLFGVEGSFNLYHTPTWIFLRHKEKFATGLNKVANSSIRFQQSNKLNTLETSDGTVNIIENQDIKVTATPPEASIGEPFFDPLKLKVEEVPLSFEEFKFVNSNRNKIYKLSRNIGGYILKMEYFLSKREAKFELIKKHGFTG